MFLHCYIYFLIHHLLSSLVLAQSQSRFQSHFGFHPYCSSCAVFGEIFFVFTIFSSFNMLFIGLSLFLLFSSPSSFLKYKQISCQKRTGKGGIMRKGFVFINWSRWGDLNPRPADYEFFVESGIAY